MADIHWIKLKTTMFDDEKIRLIESMPEADAVINIWIRLLVLAGKTNDSGLIYIQRNMPYTVEMLATLFGKKVNVVRLAIDTLSKFDMINTNEDGAIEIVNWEKHQNIDGMDRVKKLGAERVKRYRERKKLDGKSNVTGNVTVTGSNATDSDSDSDTESDNKKNGPTFAEPSPPDQPRENKTKKEPKHYATDSAEYELASHLLERIIGNNPDYEKKKLMQPAYRERKLQKWADVIRLTIERDGHTPQQIHNMIDWAQNNDFWWPNILSASKLRDQYEKLKSQALAERKAPHGKTQVRESLPDWAQDGYQHKSKQVDPEEAAQIKEQLNKMKMMQQTER